MKDEAPKTERTPNDNISDSVTTHPAFAEIGVNRCSISGGGAYLYGSEFVHPHAITITISRSEMHRSLSNDRYHPNDELIEVMLSEAQWAGFVSSMHGHSVPCTIVHIDRNRVPGIAAPEVRTQDKFDDEVKRKIAGVMADLKRVMELHEKGGSKREIRDLLHSIERNMGPNMEFVAEQFGEHMETVTSQAKAEVEGFARRVINETGLAALKGEKLPFSIQHNKEKK